MATVTKLDNPDLPVVSIELNHAESKYLLDLLGPECGELPYSIYSPLYDALGGHE